MIIQVYPNLCYLIQVAGSHPGSNKAARSRRYATTSESCEYWHLVSVLRSDLTSSTKMFGRLADPNGENNALSQVLYGLALR